MLRDKNLVPLSRQHQHALALCVRLDRALQAGEVDLEAWQAEIRTSFEDEICVHFDAEEKALFPLASKFPKLKPIIEDLRTEHAALRDLFARAASGSLTRRDLQSFIRKLATHIRREERELFEAMQGVMSETELADVGSALDISLQPAVQACKLSPPKA